MINGLPAYSGPYRVGTCDLEVPVEHLTSPSAAPPPDSSIATIKLRLFYPCDNDKPQKKSRSVRWIPSPQHEYLAEFASFLGLSKRVSNLAAYALSGTRLLNIPAKRDAPLLPPTTSTKRWPVMVFSHGLGGCRNSYSQICGRVASHGVVVAAPESRDGSAPVTFLRRDEDRRDESGSPRPSLLSVPYRPIPYQRTPENDAARTRQLRIRLWELGLVYDLLLRLDDPDRLGAAMPSELLARVGTMDGDGSDHRPPLLESFSQALDVHRPGAVAWAGHSFGAASTVQFVKSVFYPPPEMPLQAAAAAASSYEPLFVPDRNSPLVRQVSPRSVLALLDIWMPPLQYESTRWLNEKPLPCYHDDGPPEIDPTATTSPPLAYSPVVAILSEGFYKWNANVSALREMLVNGLFSPQDDNDNDNDNDDSSARRAQQQQQQQQHQQQHRPQRRQPAVFFVEHSAHLSQSDFGLLFPFLSKVALKAREPERILRLNARAVLEAMRCAGLEVAPTSDADMELSSAPLPARRLKKDVDADANANAERKAGSGGQDAGILSTDGSVRGWMPVSLEGAVRL